MIKHPFISYIIAIISGALGVFAFSPFDYWIAAYLSLIGLLFVIKTPKKSTALFSAFLWGLAFFSFGVNWLHVSIHKFGNAPLFVSYALVFVLAAYLALYPLLFAYVVRRFNVSAVVLYPVIWTFTEFLRGWLFTGFPWLQFGYSQIDSPFAAFATLFGITGLTFFVMWSSAVCFSLVLHLWQKRYAIALFNGGLLFIIGGLVALSSQLQYTHKVENRALTISLAQGNIEQNLKWDPEYLEKTLSIYEQLIAEQLGKSDLVILPESALPTLENHIQPFLRALQYAGEESGTESFIGTVYHSVQTEKLLNSIIHIGSAQQPYREDTTHRYNKHHLVPFGEYVPLESLLRPLGSVFNLPMSAFQSGEKKQAPLMAKNHYFTPAICYEIILGEQLRQNLQSNTDFILTLSNDAWFGDSIGPWQHLQMARMRALELGKPVIRATNTGISAFIDEQGKIIAQAPQFKQTSLTQRVTATQGATPYSAFGNLPLYILCFILLSIRLFKFMMMKLINRKK